MTTSADLMELLKASICPPSRPSPGYVVGELQDPTGTRRADALFVPLGHATRGTLHGYEFKVSRSDLIVELRDPMKADPWMRYCTTWTLFVSDPRMIEGLTIPDEWGIVAPPVSEKRRALQVIRTAPKLHPLNVLPAFLQIAARLYYGDGPADDRMVKMLAERAQHQDDMHALYQRANAAEAQVRALDSGVRDRDRDFVNDVIAAARKHRGDWRAPQIDTLGAERIAALLVDMATLERVRDELAHADEEAMKDLERVHAERGRRIAATRALLGGQK